MSVPVVMNHVVIDKSFFSNLDQGVFCMLVATTARRLVIAAGFCLATLSSGMAQNMVSIKGNTVNMRSGPGTHTEPLWELQKGYPLQVLKRQNRWLQVKDFEGDTGWVARSLTGNTPHHVQAAAGTTLDAAPAIA
jgi:SH3-like domain-containing protein